MRNLIRKSLMSLGVCVFCSSLWAIDIVNLKTEFMKNPLGTDVARPRFSWQMSATRSGALQKSYRLVVANSENNLQNGNYCYDTGDVASGLSVGVVYNGDALLPSTRYFWKVTVKDDKGESATSSADWFETGLLGMGWNRAQWIGSPKNILAKYRSQFVVDYDFKLLKGAQQSVFIFGAKNTSNYVSLNFNLKSGAPQMILSHKTSGVEKVDFTEDIASILSSTTAGATHHVTMSAAGPRGFNLHISIDGKQVKNTHLPKAGSNPMMMRFGPPDEYGFTINYDAPEEPNANARMYSIGYCQPQGEPAEYSNFRISENTWNETLSNDNQVRNAAGDGKLVLWQPGADVSAPMLRKTITIDKQIASARLYATARGVYEFTINGHMVGKDFLNPGWTDYRYRIMYNTFDITSLLKQGNNGIGVTLGTGWFSDMMGFNSTWQDQYGVKQSVMAMILVNYTDGTKQTFVTDGSWKAYTQGPIEANSLLNGEDYNAQKEVVGWTDGVFDDSSWNAAVVVPAPSQTVKLQGYVGMTIQNNVTLTAKTVKEVDPHVYVYDLGQNMAGIPRLKNIKGKAGQTITIHFAEALYPDVIPTEPVAPYTVEMYQKMKGRMYMDNYRSALATDHYTLKGDAAGETFEPHFTSHGFRYISIEGLDAPLALEDVQGVVLESIGEQMSNFETSNKDINRLFENVVWGERGNFLSVPTDCPQRDERMGWTGDAQVFSRAATYNMNVDPFYTRWFYTVRDDQANNGGFGGYYPELGVPPVGASADGSMQCGGWQDVGVVVPWQVYLQYGDIRMLEDHYPSMLRFMEYLERNAKDFIQPFGGTGDWLAPVFTNTMLTNTAYSAYDAQIMEKIATALGKKDDAVRFHRFYENICKAFNKSFINADGLTVIPASSAPASDPMGSMLGMSTSGSGKKDANGNEIVDTQTSYVLPLYFGMLQGENKTKAVNHLLDAIKKSNYTLTTGFVGTPYICLVLSEAGYPEEAYKLFEQTEYPSWLFPVKQGATTMWERWNSYTIKNGFGPVSMNSFNHYSYGAIEEWMMSRALGIRCDEQNPGYKHFTIEPEVGGTLQYAKGGFESVYGKIQSEWQKNGSGYTCKVTVPANTTATLYLAAKSAKNVKCDAALKPGSTTCEKVSYELLPGTYTFTVNN